MWWKLVLLCVLVYGIALLFLVTQQRTFMYHPDRGEELKFLALAKSHGVAEWRDSSGQLIGWKRISEKPARKRMLILHGNGGHALSRTYFMDGFGKIGGGDNWEFYCLEYPGYGWRSGNATEIEIVAAAESAMKQLLATDSRPLFVTGESLGTGVACLLAERHPKQVAGLLLVTPYTSTVDVAAGRFPMFPVRYLMRDRYEAANALQKYSGPVAVLLAGRDYIVPTRIGQALYDGYDGPKKLWIQPKAGHNTLDYDPQAKWWNEVASFLSRR